MNAVSHDLLASVVTQAQALGAHEVSVGLSEGTHTEITRRDGQVEQASESSTRRLSLSLLVDDRYSSHSTSDLRPDALSAFLAKAVAATRLLEPDPARALPPAELCGRGPSEAHLDHLDPAWADHTPEARGELAEALEQVFLSRKDEAFVSATVSVSDGSGKHTQLTSHGFDDTTEGAWFATSGTVTLADEGGRRPEGSGWYAARYLTDLPGVEQVAADAYERAHAAIGSGPIESGKYTMVLQNRVAGRILGTLVGPLSGGALHHGRSCLAGKLGEAIGSSKLTILDDPTIPRGLGSGAWDGDLLVAKPRTILENGVLRSYYLSMYHARKLGMDVTTSGRTNWVIPPGDTPWTELAAAHDKAILVTGFLGGNANPVTGDFSFGIRGRLLEGGEPSTKLSEMNVTGNLLTIFHQLAEVADDPWQYSATLSPTLVFENVQFSGT